MRRLFPYQVFTFCRRCSPLRSLSLRVKARYVREASRTLRLFFEEVNNFSLPYMYFAVKHLRTLPPAASLSSFQLCRLSYASSNRATGMSGWP